jgi:DNA replication protein DnaC
VIDADPQECPECSGRGWTVVPDGGAGTARPCACREHLEAPHLERLAGIPERYRKCRLETFQVDVRGFRDELLAARTIAGRYVDTFIEADGRFRQSGLLFVGPPGVGKTHLASAVLLELIRRYRVQGRFVDFTSLIYQIQSTFGSDSPESKQGLLEPVMAAEVLVLDELGVQKPTPWVAELLYLVLNTRYTRRLPTLFTTNYWLEPEGEAEVPSAAGQEVATRGPERLAQRIPAVLVSRLYEMAQLVTIRSVDYRKTFRRYQHQV